MPPLSSHRIRYRSAAVPLWALGVIRRRHLLPPLHAAGLWQSISTDGNWRAAARIPPGLPAACTAGLCGFAPGSGARDPRVADAVIALTGQIASSLDPRDRTPAGSPQPQVTAAAQIQPAHGEGGALVLHRAAVLTEVATTGLAVTTGALRLGHRGLPWVAGTSIGAINAQLWSPATQWIMRMARCLSGWQQRWDSRPR